jgi:plastocyanin
MKQVAALLALALASFALVACGGGDDNETTTSETTAAESTNEGAAGGGEAEKEAGGAIETLEFEADPNGGIAFTTTEETAKAGKVEVEFNNPQALIHDVRIEDSGGNDVGGTEQITSESTSAVVELKPGTYTFYCSVPSHREQGMEGTLTVE